VIDPLTRLPLRLAMRSIYAILKLRWFVSRPNSTGAHAIALTPASRIILVKLRYVGGWRVPGGGVDAGEKPEVAVLRELREEIGMTSHGAVRNAFRSEERITWRNDSSTIFVVTEVEYAPRWSLEIEAVTEAPLDRLPPGTSERTRRWLARARPIVDGLPLHADGDTPR
jgi:8-oxo-dGTP pyrophosphatase MutT (NUDIX family)